MFDRKQRRFRRRSNGRKHSHGGGGMQSRMRTNSFSNGQQRNNFRPSLSAEKLFEKYSSLAKEAMSTGDKTSSENYLQHADHFMRIIEDKNRNRVQNKVVSNQNPPAEEKKVQENPENIQDIQNKSKE
tara:strand:- start:1620 stop:2003 length:384 start_codon:yes stop_codon:yes gene_type:complete